MNTSHKRRRLEEIPTSSELHQQQQQNHGFQKINTFEHFKAFLKDMPTELSLLIYSFCLPYVKMQAWMPLLKKDKLLSNTFELLLNRVDLVYHQDGEYFNLEGPEVFCADGFNDADKMMELADFVLECVGKESVIHIRSL
ncbi:unnamed protein product [Ambrosiozyma monospora]|uniref:Unnamed protein product n=1 Tax=Ambrosiozyma monospora TaxID=43982 RepID=A0ACB5TA85_AMBMO|nr:unnamed protein product [Ambrosiozyma monospora]